MLVEEYDYLGFPMTPRGIDFCKHLNKRMTAAVNRTLWLSLYSDGWGVAHRLRVYKQYLAPMFEYGAPLVSMWVEAGGHSKTFMQETSGFMKLISWITNCHEKRWQLQLNLCGLTPLKDRFASLKTSYHLAIEQSPVDDH